MAGLMAAGKWSAATLGKRNLSSGFEITHVKVHSKCKYMELKQFLFSQPIIYIHILFWEAFFYFFFPQVLFQTVKWIHLVFVFQYLENSVCLLSGFYCMRSSSLLPTNLFDPKTRHDNQHFWILMSSLMTIFSPWDACSLFEMAPKTTLLPQCHFAFIAI